MHFPSILVRREVAHPNFRGRPSEASRGRSACNRPKPPFFCATLPAKSASSRSRVHKARFTKQGSPGKLTRQGSRGKPHEAGFTRQGSPGRVHQAGFTRQGSPGSVHQARRIHQARRVHQAGFTRRGSRGRVHQAGFTRQGSPEGSPGAKQGLPGSCLKSTIFKKTKKNQ